MNFLILNFKGNFFSNLENKFVKILFRPPFFQVGIDFVGPSP